MKNKDIISGFVGGAFFAVPYLGLSLALGPALAIGTIAFGASELVLSGINGKESLKDTDKELYQKLMKAKQQNKEINNLISKVELNYTKSNLREIHDIVDKIIETI